MLKKYFTPLLIIFLFYTTDYCQGIKSLNLGREFPGDSIYYAQLKTDSLFNSSQIITLLAIHKNSDRYHIEFGHSKTELKPTSSFAKNKNAAAAVNGGFFDMTKGGSVAYFEINDTVINFTHSSESRWAKPSSIINSAIIVNKEKEIYIRPAETDEFYEQSKNESAVLLTGPLLLQNSEKIKLPDTDFANRRHPRTFFCTTNEYAVFLTVDGRRKEAAGMSLTEAQEFLLSIGCRDAINLDGGGSTTMWIKGKGVVNYPSGTTGERPVSNVLLIIQN